jgi:hypothetical protein
MAPPGGESIPDRIFPCEARGFPLDNRTQKILHAAIAADERG